jgi:hypothetical protein
MRHVTTTLLATSAMLLLAGGSGIGQPNDAAPRVNKSVPRYR